MCMSKCDRLSAGGFETPSNTWFLGPTRVQKPNSTEDTDTYTYTNRATSVAIGRI